MAENNDLKVIVGLDIPKSVVEIEGDLKIIEKVLAKSDEGKLKITAGLNVGKTIGIINKQLSELKIDGSRLKITPTLDIDFGKQLDDDIVNSTNFTRVAQSLKKQMDLVKEAGKSVTDELTKQLRIISENFDKEPQKVENAFAKIEKIYNDYSKISRKTTAERNQDISNLSVFFNDGTGINKSFNNATIISKYWYDRVVSAYGDENAARNALREAFGKYQILAENESRKAAVKFDEIFRDYTETDSQGKTITYANSQENTFKQYVEARKQAYSWTKEISKEEMQNERERLASIRESVLALLNLVKVNEQVAQSQRDIAQAQREVQNTDRDQLSFDSHNVVDNIGKTIELNEKRVQTEKEINALIKERDALKSAISANQAKIDDSYVFDNMSELEAAIQKDQAELKRIEQEIANKTSANEYIKEQIKELGNQLKEERQGIEDSTRQMKDNMSNGFAGSSTNISSEYLSNDISQIKLLTESAKDAEQSFKDLLVSMGDTKGKVTSKEFADATGQVNSFTVAVKSGTGAVENFRYAFKEEQEGFVLENITAANAGIQRLTESTQKYYASMEATITTAQASAQKLKATWSDTNGGKSVKDAEHLDSLKQKYAELMSMIEGLRGQSEIEAKQTIADIKAKEKEINSLIGTYHNAEKVATDLRTKGYETVKEITGTKINTFEEKIKGALGSTEQLSAEMTNLRTKFESLNSATTQAEKSTILTSILDDLDKAKAKLENLKEVKKNFDDTSKSVNKVISDLETMGRTQIFNTHSNNADVVEFQGKIKGLSDTAKQVKADLNALGDSKAIPPELKARVDNLRKSFDELNGSNKTLQANLRQNDGWARTERQIQTLTARVKEYMATNTKAAKKYSGQFDGLLSGLSQAEMNKDSEAVRRLSADFQILRSQIKAAGDTGKTLGQMIVDNAKKFSMWFSLTSNIMRAWRTLKQMVTTVKELDTAMTALKRVTEGTSATYNKFLETAIKNAKELKMDLVDLVTQSAEWAKRGYSIEDSSKLAKASGIYSVVADIDNATAVQHLTTVMKTYNMTVEEAMDITDRLDNVANRYALTAADLGEILSHSVSAMKVAGNTLDEVIALGGAITQVTGSANEAGSTLKVLSMRLRGAKSDLESASEDTEGMVESTSKLRERIMALTNVNGTGGFDIMADADNFKSTYEIMQGISKVWKDISDVNQANKICLYVQKCA